MVFEMNSIFYRKEKRFFKVLNEEWKKIKTSSSFISTATKPDRQALVIKNFGHLFGGLANECASSNRRFASMAKRMTTLAPL